MRPVRGPSHKSLRTSSSSSDIPKPAKQPSERHFDDEALSRMDDEGGSNDPSVNPPDAAGKPSEVVMTSEVVNLQVTASVPIDCGFWSEDDGWKGLCKSLPVTVRGSSFEDAKKNMAAELQGHIEGILREQIERKIVRRRRKTA